MKFFERMLTVFLLRHIPDSTSAKPRFMKNTSDAVNTTQIVSSAIVNSSGVFAAALVLTDRARHAATMQPNQYLYLCCFNRFITHSSRENGLVGCGRTFCAWSFDSRGVCARRAPSWSAKEAPESGAFSQRGEFARRCGLAISDIDV